ncbi:zinc finger protein 184 [Aplysia californica]|uniref:Zinc finger protein 184 n=1 Tax=Aplysia californica TaxID=6500 RepID=A0ABM1A0R3_APLCA|nr:zinc finger protein 184 [Aplysia californica]
MMEPRIENVKKENPVKYMYMHLSEPVSSNDWVEAEGDEEHSKQSGADSCSWVSTYTADQTVEDKRLQPSMETRSNVIKKNSSNANTEFTVPSDICDLNFEKCGKSGCIIVTADSVQLLRVAFDKSIHVQVVFNSLKKVEKDDNDDMFNECKGESIAQNQSEEPVSSSVVEDTELKILPTDVADTNLTSKSSTDSMNQKVSREELQGSNKSHGRRGKRARRSSERGLSKSKKKRKQSKQEEDDACYCRYCDLSLRNWDEYVKHLLNEHPKRKETKILTQGGVGHSNKERHKGDDASDSEIDIPSIISPNVEEFKCNQCEATYKTQSGFDRHRKWHSKEESGKDLQIVEKQEIRTEEIFEEDVDDDDSDDFDEKSKDSSIKKTNSQTPRVDFPCSFCEVTLPSYNEHLEHYRLKHVEEFTCKFCNETFHSITACRRHSKTHGPFCFLCKEKLPNRMHVNYHWRENHVGEVDSQGNKIFEKCPECILIFANKRKLINHMKHHERLNQRDKHICHICGKALQNISCYAVHMKSHSADKGVSDQIPCDQCGKMFANEMGLNKHHSNQHSVKPYKCKVCGKGFATTKHLYRHESLHTTGRPYQCSVCQKCFSQSYNLTIHMRTHTKEKPFSCSHCTQRFSHKCSLQGHVASKHKFETMLS